MIHAHAGEEEARREQGEAMIDVSIVVPVYNEQDNVVALHKQLLQSCKELKVSDNLETEIIFIDDGSVDATGDICNKLSPLQLITFRKNFGQTAAFDAGFKAAEGTYIVTMDGDLQNDPKDIKKLITALEDGGYDVVSGWRRKRRDTLAKRFFSRGANVLRKILLQDTIRDSGCSLKIYRAESLKGLHLFGEMHRFIPALLEMEGWKIGEIAVAHRPRTAGVTKYNWKRAVKGFVDMVYIWFWRSYGARPIHFFGGAGILFLILGTSILGWMFYIKIFMDAALSERIWPLMGVFFVVLGVQCFIFGLLADIATKNYYKSHNRMNYVIKKVTKNS